MNIYVIFHLALFCLYVYNYIIQTGKGEINAMNQVLSAADLDDYQYRLRCGIALLDPIAFALEKGGMDGCAYADAVTAACRYLTELSDELYRLINTNPADEPANVPSSTYKSFR